MSDFALQDGQTVVFIGDSITDCGRRENINWHTAAFQQEQHVRWI